MTAAGHLQISWHHVWNRRKYSVCIPANFVFGSAYPPITVKRPSWFLTALH